MSCRGVLFAIQKSQSEILRKCKSDKELVEYIQKNIESEWDEKWLCETDQSWDAMHRCFAGGKLEVHGGKPPLNAIIFGGEILNTKPDYYVAFKSSALVKEIAKEISGITKEEIRELYNRIGSDYQGEINDEDFEYTWEWFQCVRTFYVEVAQSQRDVIFTVDQ
ncbi:MAG: YfbM family protein [Clostridia bacterium]|nr:YfbM family protein [Clostridia bacterium]